MIQADQPTRFPSDVQVALSSRSDGTVLDKAVGVHGPAVVTNRTAFCEREGISYGNVVYQRILYDETQTYNTIKYVDESMTCKHIDEVCADVLITTDTGIGLMLPVADCVATVLYDAVTKQLALAHIGRHSTIAGLMAKTIRAMCARGAKPEDIVVWMAPSVKASHYVMKYFDHADDEAWRVFVRRESDGIHLDLQGYNRAAAMREGVSEGNIHISPINTATSREYFSHSQGDTSGRFAVLAMRRT